MILLFFALLVSHNLNAQELPPTEEFNDTVAKPKHPFRRAAMYSALLPGGGQIYNHLNLPKTSRRKYNVYWKVPLIYGAIGGSVFLLISQQREIGLLREEFRFRINNSNQILHIQYQNYDNQAILQLQNNAQTRRDLFILTTVLAYAINVLDAAVEAHFINFDVSGDISMNLQPILLPNTGLGLSLALKFK
jgi:hypothetical protein